jgi:hypothetical protein
MAYFRGPGVKCEGALTGNDGKDWVGIHRGVMSFFVFCLWVFRDGAVFYDLGVCLFLFMMITFSGYGTGMSSGSSLRVS